MKTYGHKYYPNYHRSARPEEFTIVLDLPQDYSFWTKNLVGLLEGGTIELPMGVSKCSKKDQFCRKTGREEADKRIVSTSLTAAAVNRTQSGRINIWLSDGKYAFVVSVKPDTQPQLLHPSKVYQ